MNSESHIMKKKPAGLYIHIPFCLKKCGKEGMSIEEMLLAMSWLKENPKEAIYKIQMLKNKKQRKLTH